MISFGVKVLGILAVGSCAILQGQGQETENKTIRLEKQSSLIHEFENKKWAPIANGQFMRDILFQIHPDSPSNRDAWSKSGYLEMLEKSPSTVKKLTETLPNEKFEILPMKSQSENARMRTPLFRKPTLLGLSPRKRIPKHIMDATSPSSVVKDNNTKVVTAQATPVVTSTNFHRRSNIPAASKTKTDAKGQVPPVGPKSVGRCLIQSVAVPPQAQQPNFYYPMQFPVMPQQMSFQFPSFYSPSTFPQNQIQYQQPLASEIYNAPLQNRFPYTVPTMIYYLRPVPLDLLGMNGDHNPKGESISKSPAPMPSTEKIKGLKKGIFIVPSLQAQVIVSSEANEQKETNSGQGMDNNEFHKENFTESGESEHNQKMLASSISTITPKDVDDDKSVKQEQLVVDAQEPRTEEIPSVTQSQQEEQSTKVSTLVE